MRLHFNLNGVTSVKEIQGVKLLPIVDFPGGAEEGIQITFFSGDSLIAPCTSVAGLQLVNELKRFGYNENVIFLNEVISTKKENSDPVNVSREEGVSLFEIFCKNRVPFVVDNNNGNVVFAEKGAQSYEYFVVESKKFSDTAYYNGIRGYVIGNFVVMYTGKMCNSPSRFVADFKDLMKQFGGDKRFFLGLFDGAKDVIRQPVFEWNTDVCCFEPFTGNFEQLLADTLLVPDALSDKYVVDLDKLLANNDECKRFFVFNGKIEKVPRYMAMTAYLHKVHISLDDTILRGSVYNNVLYVWNTRHFMYTLNDYDEIRSCAKYFGVDEIAIGLNCIGDKKYTPCKVWRV